MDTKWFKLLQFYGRLLLVMIVGFILADETHGDLELTYLIIGYGCIIIAALSFVFLPITLRWLYKENQTVRSNDNIQPFCRRYKGFRPRC